MSEDAFVVYCYVITNVMFVYFAEKKQKKIGTLHD